MTAGWQKITRADAAGFLPTIEKLRAQLPDASLETAANLRAQIFNNQVDIVVTAVFMALVLVVVAAGALLWWRLLTGRAERKLAEDPAVPHPELEIVEG
jgi:carbon starvation protein